MMKKTKKTIKKEKRMLPSKEIVVQPIQLPVVMNAPRSGMMWGNFLLVILLLMFNIMIWSYTFLRAFEIYIDCYLTHTTYVVVPRVKHKQNVVALIGTEEISLDEVKAFVAEVPQLAEVPFEQVYPNILEMMINDKVIANGANRYGIQKDPQIKRMIKAAGDQIIAQAYMSKRLESALTEEDLKEAYDEEVKNFKPEEEIHARHILVPTEKQAQDILIQLKAGADFGLLADQKSIDKNAPQGDLGYFTREMMIPEFADAVFSMKKGQMSGPIQTVYGWHIIQVEDRRPTQPPAFEQVKDQMQHLAMEKKIPQILEQEREFQKVKILRPTLDPEKTSTEEKAE